MSKQDIKKAVCKAMENMPHKDAIRRIRLFGSHLHGDAKADSDVDLLVDFEKDAGIGFFELFDIQDKLKKELKKEVDLVTPKALSEFFRDEVLAEAAPLYEKRSV